MTCKAAELPSGKGGKVAKDCSKTADKEDKREQEGVQKKKIQRATSNGTM